MGKKARLKKIKENEPDAKKTVLDFPMQPLLGFVLFLLIVLGIVLRLSNLGNVPARSPDEMVYTRQAKAIAIDGIDGIRAIVKEYNSTQDLWKYPPPTRVGYLCLIAAVMKMTGIYDPMAGVYLSCFLSILTLLLLIAVGLRFFNHWVTLYALLFMSVSPMSLAVARRSWQETTLSFTGLLLIYLACEITRNSRRWIPYIVFVIAGSYLMLVKSTGVVIYGLCAIWLLWVLFFKERFFARGFYLMALGAIAAIVSYAILINLAGGLSAFKDVLTHFKWGVTTSEYAREYASGPWYRLFDLLWLLTPINTVIFFVGYIGVISLRKNTHYPEISLLLEKGKGAVFGIIFFITMLLIILFAAKEYSLNWRYVAVLNVPFYLVSGLGFWVVILSLKRITRGYLFYSIAVIMVAASIVFAVSDYCTFKKVIVSTGIKDLSIRLLKEAAEGSAGY